ncbi:Hypothetical_protein [Hexamita inflata]|uniref:Hypothetical_protein n=1 Tax=Hexamita inflata TaxID=28002 RepID=A0ABP1H763_9EUKA
MQLNTFSLFGFSLHSQLITDSSINVSILFQVLSGALICILCDIDVQSCNLVFIASGQQISGMIIQPKESFTVQQSFIQFRISSTNSSGLANVINESSVIYIISQCKLTGSNIIQSGSNGYIASVVLVNISLNITQFDICVDSTSRFGKYSVPIFLIGTDSVQCDICDNQSVVYGLCSKILQYSEIVNGMYLCVYPFEYVDNMCVCVTGYMLNETKCINIVEILNNIGVLIENTTNQLMNIIFDEHTTVHQNLSSINNYMSILENNISNFSINISALDNRILGNTTDLQNIIKANSSILEQYIQQNATVLDWRIFNNMSQLNYNINSLNTSLQNLTVQLNYMDNSLQKQNQTNEQQQSTINDLKQQISCIKNQGYDMINGYCVTLYALIDSNFECSQEIFTTIFDIHSVTDYIITSNNFSASYVFSTATVIQNAFIDISDNVYSTTVNPLFQSQSTFTSLKIRFGTQSLNSGSLLLSSSSVSINNMNIISRSSSKLTVNSAQQLNILMSAASSANITNLLVNLSFAPSNGNISLIDNIISELNISGYLVLGTYISTGTVAMIGLTINSAIVTLNQVTFRSTEYNVGNSSSYLFGSAISGNTINMNNIAVILGNSSNFLLLGSISTTSSSYYLFGGIVAYINGNSDINVNNVIYDSYQQFSINYVNNSGFLFGYAQSSFSRFNINNGCLQQNMTSTTTQFNQFGLIGYNSGTSIQNIYVIFYAQAVYVNYFGIIGSQSASYAEVINWIAVVSFSASSRSHIGSIVGVIKSQNFSSQNIVVIGGNISSGLNATSSSYNVGGFIGYQYPDQNTTIENSIVSQMNISGQVYVGGFFGQCNKQLNLISSKIQLVRLSGQNCGIAVGFNGGTYSFSGSSSSQNYINNILQNNCVVLSSTWSAVGC